MQILKRLQIARWSYIFFIVQILMATSFAQDEQNSESALIIETQPEPISIVKVGESATLSFVAKKGENGVAYQWYQSVDGTIDNGMEIVGATEGSYTTTVFSNKEIRYYYCIATVGAERVISDVVVAAYTGLPVLYVNTPESVEITSKEIWTENASLTLVDAEDESWNFENVSMSIRGRGNTTWSQRKKPYAIKLDKKREIMGMPQHKRWVLIANFLDNSFLKNHMAFYFSEKMEMDYTVRGKFVNLIFNGVYRGLYWLGEAIKVDENRVNVNDGSKKIKDDENKDYLIEIDSHYDEPVKFKSSIRQLPYMVKNDDYMVDDEGNLTSGGIARLGRLQSNIEKLEKLLYPDYVEGMKTNKCAAPDETYSKIIDVDSWAKFWLVNELMNNEELYWPKSAYFTYESEKNIFKAGPVWDFDYASLSQRETVRLTDYIYFNALFKSPLFKAATKRIWSAYSSSIDVETEIEKMRAYLKIAAGVDKIRWGEHNDPQQKENLADFDAYVDFFKAVLINKMSVVDDYVTQELPQITVVAPEIVLPAESFEYNGQEIIPQVSIMNDDHSLVEGTDYTLSFYDNVNVGTATIIFAGKGNYAGLQEKTFPIVPKTTTYAAVKILEDQNGKRAEIDGEYTGKDTIDVSEAIDVNLIDFKRNVQAGVPSTVVLPFSLPAGASVNAKFYQLQSVGPNGKGGWKAVFNNIGDDKLPQANIPYAFILHEGEEKLQFNLNGGNASVQTTEIQNVDGENGKWYFTGTYAYKVWNENNEDDELGRAYAFAGSNNEGGATKGQFGKVTAGAWASPMRAYLCKKDASLTPAMMGRPVAPGESAEARYSVEMLPDMIDVDFVDSSDNGEHTTFAGRLNTRTGEFKMMRNYDLKGRKLNEKPRSRGAYYGKRILKK